MSKIKYLFYRVRLKIQEIIFNRQTKGYPDPNREDSKMKHIWGIKSWDDLTSSDCGIHTMNDFDITYLKKENKYVIGIETIYSFEDGRDGEKQYIKNILDRFTEWMESTGYNTTNSFDISDVFTYGIRPLNNIITFDTIEEAYRTFKFYANGFIGQTQLSCKG